MLIGKSEKLVSIIVPAYNVEKYIERCLESILEQTYQDIEVIVVDDGSHDGTWEIVGRFMKMDSRIMGYQRENRGVSAARNFALKRASGDYIQFVDADDYISRFAVEKLVNTMESNCADWLNFQYHRVDETENSLDEYDFIIGHNDISGQQGKFEFLRDVLMEYRVGYEIWDKLYVTRIIRQNDLKFDENCHIGEDLEFNICYSMYANSLVCLKDRLYFYRVRSGSAMQSLSNFSSAFEERLIVLRGIQEAYSMCFTGDYKNKYYQLSCKLFRHACQGHTTEEVAEVAMNSRQKKFCLELLTEILRHKRELKKFLPEEIANTYWREILYIFTKLNGSLKGRLYLGFYDLYRKLGRRDTIAHLKVV
ncbi:glycosyltransferase family 2 protein [Butyrivibrio sp. FCS006]|uniref:glycosyltransferase family 2 protein n=1 Tax=Butyrivibrio sp. FCS006 TaxID=1280684 RepID=UPI0004201913|nr:glycosyltransferase family 2 protein [Butyrivibrio sp. FCS006]